MTAKEGLALGLVLGKVGYAAPSVYPIRFSDNEPIDKNVKVIQVAINNVAQTVLGTGRTDRIETEELLFRASIPSINCLTARGIALEAWKVFRSTDRPGKVN